MGRFSHHVGVAQRGRTPVHVLNDWRGGQVWAVDGDTTTIRLGTGIHSYWREEKGLPLGVCPAVVQIWDEAIMNGWYQSVGT